MNAFFNRWLPAGTLALWGAVILYFWGSGRLDALLQAEFRTYAVIAGFLLLVGSLVLAFSKVDASCCVDAACSHAMGRNKAGRILTFAIILLPLALKPFGSKAALDAVRGMNVTASLDLQNVPAAVRADYEKRMGARPEDSAAANDNVLAKGTITPPPPLPLPKADGDQPPPPAATATTPPGSQPPAPGADHPAAAQQESFAEYLQRAPDGSIVAEVLDLLYAAQDNTLRKDFEDKKVQMIVQYMPDTTAGAPSQRFKGVRMFMTCCAADSRPIATLIESDKKPEFPEMTWVKVTGTATFPVERGRRVSVVRADKVEKTEPPAESMLN